MHTLEDEIMNSHNVVSLFMNVPLTQAMSVIRKRLESDNTLCERTNLLTDDIMSLLEFVLSTTYFQFDGCFYQQVFGTPMGSPVLVTVADLYMEDLENQLMDTASLEMKPKMWKRYIDDSFEVLKWNQRDLFTEHLNGMDATGIIRFMSLVNIYQSLPIWMIPSLIVTLHYVCVICLFTNWRSGLVIYK